MNKNTVSVVGLGKLGSPMLACFAAKGYSVIGVDVNQQYVDKLNQGLAPVNEPELDDLIRNNRERIRATCDYKDAVLNSEASFLIIPTPTDGTGGFSLSYGIAACEEIGKVLKTKKDYHLVVMTSTVMPGATGKTLKDVLEKASGKRCGPDFGLCYSPEFIALGCVVKNLKSPDFVLIGESDAKAGSLLEAFYKKVCDNDPPVARMNFVNAELTKIALNTFVTTKISFANTLARMCERLEGGDVDVVSNALGFDRRIGRKYLTGSIGYGGPCFPRDNIAFGTLAQLIGTSAPIAKATDAFNRHQIEELKNLVKKCLSGKKRAAVLGLSYKPDTEVIDESPSIALVRSLVDAGISVIAYDPVATPNAKKELGSAVEFASSAQACVANAEVIVLATPWDEFKNLNPDWFAKDGQNPIIIDCWRMLDEKRFARSATVVAMGRFIKQLDDRNA